MLRTCLPLLIAVLFSGTLPIAYGCSARQDREFARPENQEGRAVTMRPARPLEEEKTIGDRIGEAGIAILLVVMLAGSIALPILLL